MRRWRLRVLAVAAAPIAAVLFAPAVAPLTAHADPGVVVYPGMEIRQDTNLCTVGFVDMADAHGLHRGPLSWQRVGGGQDRQRHRPPGASSATTLPTVPPWRPII